MLIISTLDYSALITVITGNNKKYFQKLLGGGGGPQAVEGHGGDEEGEPGLDSVRAGRETFHWVEAEQTVQTETQSEGSGAVLVVDVS